MGESRYYVENMATQIYECERHGKWIGFIQHFWGRVNFLIL